MGEFSHFDQHGNAVMVDVTKKKETTRTAIAQGKIKVNDEIFEKVSASTTVESAPEVAATPVCRPSTNTL